MEKILLIILDGYGEGKNYKYNAVTRSATPFIDGLRKKYPKTLLKCIGEHVGLPKGSMGGSEVGHFTIGAGRVVYQSLEEINRSIKNKEFFNKKALKKAAARCRKNNSAFHIMGMISDEGVHSHLDHLFALLKFAKKEKLKKIYIHAITDGRDVEERSANEFIKKINSYIKKHSTKTFNPKLATVIGRYYAMDRDTNYNRTGKAYDLYTRGKGAAEKDALQAIKNEYKKGTETDYYINPIVLDKEGLIKSEDSVVFFNYRTDRAKQITQAFTEKNLKGFKRKPKVLPYFVCFGPYSKIAPVLYEANKVKNNLGSYLSKKGKKQLRIAETEKYAHVTFFFNSQEKEPYKGESRILIPSPKCASYAEKPEMSAMKITKALLKELTSPSHPTDAPKSNSHASKKPHDFILTNFANCDLVGHSGDFKATVKAVETLDKCLEQIVPKALETGYTVLLTADHGNADHMKYPDGSDCPAHSFNPVMFMVITGDLVANAKTNTRDTKAKPIKLKKTASLGLKNIAPTVLDIMGIKKPKEMDSESLLK